MVGSVFMGPGSAPGPIKLSDDARASSLPPDALIAPTDVACGADSPDAQQQAIAAIGQHCHFDDSSADEDGSGLACVLSSLGYADI